MLELKNVKKMYGTDLVLYIPTLQLARNIYWVKGANGSGKTTLLKMVAGLITFKGDILFKKLNLKNQTLAYRQNVSWAEAEPVFPTFMTGMDLILLYQKIRKVIQSETDLLLQLFNMTDYVNKPVGTYSAGMTKKLSLVLAFIGNPLLVVLDEPLITLDSDTFILVCTFINEQHKKHGTTFLMSSHQEPDMQLAVLGKEIMVSNQTVSYVE